MGASQARDIAGSGVDIDTALAWHLQHNHYPPVPVSMVPVCKLAIELVNTGLFDVEIELPDGVTFRGRATCPVFDIVKQHHLEFWLDESDDWEGDDV